MATRDAGCRRATPCTFGRVKVAVVGRHADLTYNATASLGAAGYEVHVVQPEGNPSLRHSRFCRSSSVVPTDMIESPDERLVGWMRPYVRRMDIDLVVAADYDLTVWLATHGDELAPAITFPLPGAPLIDWCNNKWNLMQLCESIGVNSPRTWLIDDPARIDDVELDCELVVKPLSEGFGFGVYVLESRAQLADHLRRTDRPGNGLPLLVQEYIPGVDIDATILVDHGVTIASVVQSHLPGTDSIRFVDDVRATELVAQIAKATEFHGVMDFDLRLDPATDRLAVIECNPRLPGTLLKKMFAGMNIAAAGARLAAGEPFDDLWAPTYGVHHPLRPAHLRCCLTRQWFGTELAPTRAAWRFMLVSDARYTAARVGARVLDRLRRR